MPSKAVGMDRATLNPVVLNVGNLSTCPLEQTKQAALEGIQRDIKVSLENISQAMAINDRCGPGQWYRRAFINMIDPQ